jgi:uncharacterized membrane protein
MTVSPLPASRLPRLDRLRGLALLAMVIYHLGWDLSFLGLAAPGLRENPAWMLFGHAIAASFLVLVGISLHLAHGGGLRPIPFLKRLGLVAGAALLVTLGTWWVFPEQFIFFGILHAIALGSVLALPFLRAPLWAVALAAAVVFIAPVLVQSPAFSAPALVWLGLGSEVPVSNDFVPIFPWFGFILAGVGLARSLDLPRLLAPTSSSKVAGWLERAGRNSLPIYLIHQPLLFGALALIAQAAAPVQDKETREFLSSCISECRAAKGEPQRCLAICTCAMEALKAEKLWSEVVANRITASLQVRMAGISRRCAGAEPSDAPPPPKP